MEQVVKGVSLGLMLGVLAGPIFISLVTLGVERGLRAGTAFAAGQWASDLLLLGLTYAGMTAVADWPHFKLVSGTSGGILLVGFGAGMLWTRPDTDWSSGRPIAHRTLAGLFLRGFLINTLNPFPVFFWLSLATEGLETGRTPIGSLVLYTALMGTIASTDILKVYLAKKIRRYITPVHLLHLRRAAGVGLIVFGLVLVWRVCN